MLHKGFGWLGSLGSILAAVIAGVDPSVLPPKLAGGVVLVGSVLTALSHPVVGGSTDGQQGQK